MTPAFLIFWTALAVTAYAYVGFPVLLISRALVWRRGVRAADVTPWISVLIAARNEEAVIEAKLRSVLAADYPVHLREVIVASDGSTDGTAEVVARYATDGVRLLVLPAAGKAPALEAAAAASTGEVLVFTDANGTIAPNALRQLVRPFADPDVGGVAGDQRYLFASSASAVGTGEARYWSFDRVLKVAESKAGHVISATGGLYAIRRELFEPIPPEVTDDAFLSMGVVAKGKRLVFAPRAAVYEPLAPASRTELARKTRVMTRGLRTVIARRALLNPFAHGFYALQLFSHKVLRRVTGIPVIAMLLTAPLLWGRGTVYQAAAVGLWAVVAAGATGLALSATALGRTPPLALPAYFCAVNVAALVASWNALRGRSIRSWQPARSAVGVLQPDDVPHATAPARMREAPVGLIVGVAAIAFGAIAGIQPLLAVGLIGAAVTALLLLTRPYLGTMAAIALVFSNAIVVVPRALGVPVVAVALIIPVMFAVPVIAALTEKESRLQMSPTLVCVLGYLLVLVLSTLTATNKTIALGNLGSFAIEGFGLFLVVTSLIRTREVLLRCVWAVVIVGALLSGLTIVKVVSGHTGNDFFGFAQGDASVAKAAQQAPTPEGEDEVRERFGSIPRQTGPIGEPVRWGQILVPLVPAGLFLAQIGKKRSRKLVGLGAAGLLLGGVVLTFARGDFLGLVAAIGVMVVLRALRTSHVVAGVAALLLVLVIVPGYRDRLISIKGVTGITDTQSVQADSSIRGRFTENIAAILMFTDHPATGVGPGNFPIHYQSYANLAPEHVHPGERSAHDLYLGVLAETGLLGFLAILSVFGMTLYELFRARRRAGRDEDKRLMTVFIAGVIATMITGLFLHFALIRYFWLFMALAAAAARVPLASGEEPRATEPVGVPLAALR